VAGSIQTRRSKRKTLVLDLDETLVHSTLDCSDAPDFTFPVHFNNRQHVINVRQRPHLAPFLERVAGLFEVVVFTASQKVGGGHNLWGESNDRVGPPAPTANRDSWTRRQRRIGFAGNIAARASAAAECSFWGQHLVLSVEMVSRPIDGSSSWLVGCPWVTETNRIQLVLFGMQNRTFGPYLAAINRILILFGPQ
jgi:NLI interacting factor-like phosphatase